MSRPVAITGVGAVTPLGIGARTLHERWTAGRSGIEDGLGRCSEFDPAAVLSAKQIARFKHEAAFARCNGTAPIPASSGKTVRHRLSRGGDRQVNNAIHTIAIIRAKHQPETRAYLDRRISEGKTKREAMRALKRHISRDLFKRLAEIPLTS